MAENKYLYEQSGTMHAGTSVPAGATPFSPITNGDAVEVKHHGAETTLNNVLERLTSEQQAVTNLVGEAFDATKNYNIGDRVVYQGRFYKFTNNHPAGLWLGSDVEEYTLDTVQDRIPNAPDDNGLYVFRSEVKDGVKSYYWDSSAMMDEYSYGVGWRSNTNVIEWVGNPELIADMPIHKSLRACVTKYIPGEINIGNITYGGRQEFQYWLDSTNWHKQQNGEASVLNGGPNHDLNIMIHNDEFWYKSFKNITKRGNPSITDWNEFRIATKQIDHTWKKFKAGKTSFGKLIRNTIGGKYVAGCYGDVDNSACDPSIDLVQKSTLATWQSNNSAFKPTVSVSRNGCHAACVNAGGHQLSYDEYKVLFYWLPVIEFKTFLLEDKSDYNVSWDIGPSFVSNASEISSLDRFVARDSSQHKPSNIGWPMYYAEASSESTEYHYNNLAGSLNCLPNGYTNELASGTGWKRVLLPNLPTNATSWKTIPVVRWRGFELLRSTWTNLHGAWSVVNPDGVSNVQHFYSTDNRELWDDDFPIIWDPDNKAQSFTNNIVKNSDIRYLGDAYYGWVKEWLLNSSNLGSYGELIKIDLEDSGSQFKGDFFFKTTKWSSSWNYDNPRCFIVGNAIRDYFYGWPGDLNFSFQTSFSDIQAGARFRVNDDEYESIYN